jgi:hypothetical protein
MKLSAGLTYLRPTVLMFAFFSVGAVLQTVAMRGEQMGSHLHRGFGIRGHHRSSAQHGLVERERIAFEVRRSGARRGGNCSSPNLENLSHLAPIIEAKGGQS